MAFVEVDIKITRVYFMSSSVFLSLLSDSKPLVNKETFSDTDYCARQW